MRDYWKPTIFSLSRVSFDSRGVRYTGRGRMNWNHETGFKIEAAVERDIEPADSPRRRDVVGLLGLPNHERKRAIRLNLSKTTRGHTCVYLDSLDRMIEPEKWLSLTAHRIVINEPSYLSDNQKWWYSRAFYSTVEELHFPDSISTEVKLNDYTLEKSDSIGGLIFENEDMVVRGRMLQKDQLEITWSLARSRFTRQHCWRWADAVGYALSILSFDSIKLLQHQVDRGAHRRTDIRKYEEAKRIRYGGGWSLQIHHQELIELSTFLATDHENGLICRRMFEQMVEADRQKPYYTSELILSTILEATLRTLYNKPFQDKGPKEKFVVRQYLTKFLKDYLTVEWEKACEEAIHAQRRLRHRNAHPDWLETGGGSLSIEQKEQSMKDAVYLSWFYRYMVLAISGNKTIEPKFYV